MYQIECQSETGWEPFKNIRDFDEAVRIVDNFVRNLSTSPWRIVETTYGWYEVVYERYPIEGECMAFDWRESGF